MKIQHGRSESTGYSERTGRTSAADSNPAPSATRTRQIGLDRVDVSEVAETAYRAVSAASAAREERIAALSKQVEGGQYPLDMRALSESILDFDAEPDYSV